jgi:cell shape-determining protein MreC
MMTPDSHFLSVSMSILIAAAGIIATLFGTAYRMGKKSGEIQEAIKDLEKQISDVNDNLKSQVNKLEDRLIYRKNLYG